MVLNKSTSLIALIAASMISGCAIAGAGAGILQGMPNGAAPVQPSASGSPGVAQPQNGTSANKPAVTVVTNTDSMVITVRKTAKVTGTVTYADGTKDNNIALSSTDGTIVAVNPTTGEISGVKEGVATVQVKAASDPTKFANVTVTVKEGVVEDLAAVIEPSKATIGIGETVQLDASITNSSTKTTPNGTWSSSNQQVAFVNDSGLVTGRKAGKVTISFKSDLNSTVSAKATVTVSGGEEETTEE